MRRRVRRVIGTAATSVALLTIASVPAHRARAAEDRRRAFVERLLEEARRDEPRALGEPVTFKCGDVSVRTLFQRIAAYGGANVIVAPDVHDAPPLDVNELPAVVALDLVALGTGCLLVRESDQLWRVERHFEAPDSSAFARARDELRALAIPTARARSLAMALERVESVDR
jgi:hypothetical protein